MKGNSRTPRHLSVLFPSLSTDILWKPAPASRVRFAAQKPRALDAATAFLHVPPVKKAKGRSSKVSTPAGSIRPRPTSIPDPSTLAYSSQKLVLTMGATVQYSSNGCFHRALDQFGKGISVMNRVVR